MIMAWTEEQKIAIDKRGSNILVSAGAGSGKTAVLTERITQLVLEGHPLERLLVLTFTNAAAAEMKGRVRKKLAEKNAKTPNERYSHALEVIDASNIMTFNAYTMNLARKYFDRLNISRDFGIANSYYITLKANEILDDILNRYYEANDLRLIDYFSKFKAVDDDDFKKSILNVYYYCLQKLDVEDFINTYVTDHFTNEKIDEIVKKYVKFIHNEALKIKNCLSNLRNELDYSKSSSLVEKLEDAEQRILDSSTYSEFRDFYNTISVSRYFPSKGRQDEMDSDLYKKLRDALKKSIEKFSSYVSYDSEEDIGLSIHNTKPYAELYFEIIGKLYRRLMEFKMENSYFEFGDIDRMVIRLIRDKDDIKNEVKGSLDEILIDEYQDNNDIQEAFIKLIENNNVYMVGDVKQSIYRFRNANPYIFKNKYDSYKNNNGGFKIDLNKNFRSRNEVLNNINLIFNTIMTEDLGDAAYKEEHQMNFGLTKYNDNKHDFLYDMKIMTYNIKDYNKDPDASKNDYSKEEIESFYIAQDIKEKVDSKMMIFDKDSEKLRPIRYSDFCILMDRGASFNLLKKILEYHNIPSAINTDSKLTDSPLASIIYGLVNLVIGHAYNKFDNEYCHSLLSIGRSFLFKDKLSDDYLIELVYDLKHADNEDMKNDLLNNPISNIAASIAKNVYTMSPTAIYEMIIDKYKVSENLPLIGNVDEGLIVLEYIKDFILNIESLGESLKDIKEYLNDIVSSENDIKYSLDVSNTDGVKIMNIHKSKGLEFPICYFAGLSKGFNDSDINAKIGMINDMLFFDSNDEKSPIKYVSKNDFYKADRSERDRLLYVALTRAREHMIFVMPEFDEDKELIPTDYENIKSIEDLLFLAKNEIEPYIRHVGSLDNLTTEYKESSYNVKYNASKPEYHLNDYKGDIISKFRISREVIEVLSDSEQENIDLGLHLHSIMEHLDFKNIDLSNLDDSDKDIISNVLKCKLFTNIRDAKTYHEHEFVFDNKNKEYHGIIDLLAIYDDHIDIIDYKLSNINHKEYDKQLSIYKDYVKTIDNSKPIRCYLLSLLSAEVREVK